MKKAVFISYNQALTERVAFILDQLQIRGGRNGSSDLEIRQEPR